ncbi:MFS transporter [Haladaptatus paucihalophilus]|uniref:MFS transporter n=1 Tax=Haladaptatus paucihalophilus TaxID=367189 RepID=UPI000AEAD50A|nr:MFS transporter [Haladaptatus paucihalophilus]
MFELVRVETRHVLEFLDVAFLDKRANVAAQEANEPWRTRPERHQYCSRHTLRLLLRKHVNISRTEEYDSELDSPPLIHQFLTNRAAPLFDVTYPRRVVLISGAHGVNEFFSLALPPILPLLVTDYGLTYARAGLLVSVYFAMYALFQLPAGFLADRVGQARLITLGTVVMGLGLVGASFASSYLFIAMGVAVSGLGGSVYHPAGMSLISDIESETTVGKAMGVHEVAGLLGNLLAPLMIGGVAALTGWRTGLRVAGIFGVLYAGVFAITTRTATQPTPAVSRSDPSSSGSPGSFRKRVFQAIRIPIALWVLGLVLAKFAFTLQTYGVRTYATSYAVVRTAMSTGMANGALGMFLAGGAITTLWFGSLADRYDRLHLITVMFLVAGILIGVTALIPGQPLVFVGWFFVLGMAVYATLPVVNTLISEYATQESSGSLFGIVQTASALGGVIGPALFGGLAEKTGLVVAYPAIAVVCGVACLGAFLTKQDIF